MKLNKLRIKLIEAATVTDLQEAVTTWLATQTEAELVDVQYMVDSGAYSVMITYGQ